MYYLCIRNKDEILTKKNIMKARIITKLELEQLSKSARTELLSVLEKRETSILELKKRVAKLPFKRISYRDDISTVISTDTDDFTFEYREDFNTVSTDTDDFTFVMWRKTAGEEWGNRAGNEYIFQFGKKYIRIENNYWNTTDSTNYPTETTYISLLQAGEIISLFERACEADNDVDRDRLLSLAGQQIEELARRYW